MKTLVKLVNHHNRRRTGPGFRLALAVTVMLTVVGVPSAASAAMHATDEFRSGETRPVKIAFLPPHVNLVKRRIVHSETQIDESALLAGHLATALERAFASQRYDVHVLTPDDVNADSALRELVIDAERRYLEVLAQVQTRLPRQIARRRYEAGDQMRVLAARLGVDAIGFANLDIVAAAPGAAAVAVITGIGSSGSSTMLSVSVIDGSTANIEAYFVPPPMRRGTMVGYEGIMEDPARRIGELTASTLRDLPPAEPSARRAAENDDVLSDIESLLGN